MAERTVQQWLDEIEDALEYREKFSHEAVWQDLEDCFYSSPDSYASIGPNIIWEEGDTFLSSLIVPDPEIAVDALSVGSVKGAPVVERLANKLLKPQYLNLKAEIEAASLNGYLTSKVIIKIGYDSEWGYDPRYDLGTVDKPLGMTQTQFDKKGKRIEHMNTIPGMPWAKAVHPYDFVVPWGSGTNIDELPWVAHRVIRETEYFKSDPKYKNTQNLEPQMSMRDFMSAYSYGKKAYRKRNHSIGTSSFFSYSGEPLYNEVWEIRDRINQKVIVVSFCHDKFLRNVRDPIQQAIGGYPFITDSFVWSSKHFWTPPLAYYLAQHQKDQYDIHLQAGKQRRINVAKFIQLGDALEEGEADKLLSGDVGAVAKAKKGVKDPSKCFWPMPTRGNQELYAEAEYSRRSSRSAMGFSRNQAGEFDSSSRRTAYEAGKVFQGVQTRMQRKEDAIKFMYNETIRKVMLMVFKFWTTPRNVLVGKDWVQFTGSDLQGMYDFNTSLHQRSNLSKAQRKMEAFQMMAFLSQFPNLRLENVEQYVLDAANDPEFEGFFSGVGMMSQSKPGQMQGGEPPQQEGPPRIGSGVPNNRMPG